MNFELSALFFNNLGIKCDKNPTDAEEIFDDFSVDCPVAGGALAEALSLKRFKNACSLSLVG